MLVTITAHVSHIPPSYESQPLMLVSIPHGSHNPPWQSQPLMLVPTPNVSPNLSWHSQPLLLVPTNNVSPMLQTDTLQRLTKHMQPFT